MEHLFGNPKCWPFRYVCGPAIESENERAELLYCAQVNGVTIRWGKHEKLHKGFTGKKRGRAETGPRRRGVTSDLPIPGFPLEKQREEQVIHDHSRRNSGLE